jgi:hypothetical protein
VDYPVVHDGTKLSYKSYGDSSSFNNWALTITGNVGAGTHGGTAGYSIDMSASTGYAGGMYWDRRIPFEAIIRPKGFIPGYGYLNMEAHPTMSMRNAPAASEATASMTDQGDDIYHLMARNFFGETANFFLKEDKLTTLESDTVTDDLRFPAGEVYMSRIKLRRSHNGARTYQYEYDTFGHKIGHPGGLLGGSMSGEIGGGAIGNVTYNSSYGNFGCRAYISASQRLGGQGAPGGMPVLLQAEFPIPQDPKMNPDFQETFTMYSRPSAFGPDIAGRPTGSYAYKEITVSDSGGSGGPGYTASFQLAAHDSFEGYNPAFTPPYTNGEAWVDLIFRPSSSIAYDLERILAETHTVCWRFDAGPKVYLSGSAAFRNSLPKPGLPILIPVQQISSSTAGIVTEDSPNNDNTVPSIYDGLRINVNSMQLTSSIDIFGVERVLEETSTAAGTTSTTTKTVGQKWLIRPKWETPMLNFNDTGPHPISSADSTLTLPTFASASVPRGMWHQFGIIPHAPEIGVFMEISEIPLQWLRNHYDVINTGSIYNNYDPSVGKTIGTGVKSLAKLCGFNRTNNTKRLGELKEKLTVHEAIVAIPYTSTPIHRTRIKDPTTSKRLEGEKKFISIPRQRWKAALRGTEGAGDSIRKLAQAVKKYVFPPEFDFINNLSVAPVAMYVFEFKYEFDKDDLSYIWQNVAPRNYKKLSFQTQTVTHNIADDQLINEKILTNENLRWMVFKVKQRAKTDYYDLLVDQAGQATRKIGPPGRSLSYKPHFNWPYDYLSFVELIKMDVDILLKK